MERPTPRNEQGQAPTSGGADTTERLREKAQESQGRANRERIEDKIDENEVRREAMAKDPICRMDVDRSRPPGGPSEYRGTTYYFCSASCKMAFDADPARHAANA